MDDPTLDFGATRPSSKNAGCLIRSEVSEDEAFRRASFVFCLKHGGRVNPEIPTEVG